MNKLSGQLYKSFNTNSSIFSKYYLEYAYNRAGEKIFFEKPNSKTQKLKKPADKIFKTTFPNKKLKIIPHFSFLLIIARTRPKSFRFQIENISGKNGQSEKFWQTFCKLKLLF